MNVASFPDLLERAFNLPWIEEPGRSFDLPRRLEIVYAQMEIETIDNTPVGLYYLERFGRAES